MAKNTSSKKNSAVIFGASEGGISAYHYLLEEYDILGFCDNDSSKHGSTLLGLPVYSPEQLLTVQVDEVLIASEFFEQIEQQLHRMNVDVKITVLPARFIKSLRFNQEEGLSQLSVQILHLVCQKLSQKKIRHYVDAGTLLGIYRDNALIPWDDDLDIGVHSEDLSESITAAEELIAAIESLTGVKWQVIRHVNKVAFGAVEPGAIRALKIASRNPKDALPKLDFFYKYFDGEWMDYCLSSRGFRMPAEHFKSVDTITFEGQELAIPNKVEKYLELYYGDWRTPMRDWNLSELKSTTIFEKE